MSAIDTLSAPEHPTACEAVPGRLRVYQPGRRTADGIDRACRLIGERPGWARLIITRHWRNTASAR